MTNDWVHSSWMTFSKQFQKLRTNRVTHTTIWSGTLNKQLQSCNESELWDNIDVIFVEYVNVNHKKVLLSHNLIKVEVGNFHWLKAFWDVKSYCKNYKSQYFVPLHFLLFATYIPRKYNFCNLLQTKNGEKDFQSRRHKIIFGRWKSENILHHCVYREGREWRRRKKCNKYFLMIFTNSKEK